MRYFFSALFLIFFPFSLFAVTSPSTQNYLRSAGNDPWVVMARAATGAETGNPSVARENVFALAKTILALVASGKDPRATGGSDLVAEFLQQYVYDGQIGNAAFLNDDFWGVLALRAAGVFADHPSLIGAKEAILRAQHTNGGWSYTTVPDFPDTDDTAAAIMALLELGMPTSDPVIVRAFSYLSASQNTDGGFPNVPPGPSSVDSTAWVAMALQKAGLDVSRARKFLQSTMRADGSWGSPATTAFAAIALSGKWFPVIKDITLGVESTPSVGVIERGPHSASPLAEIPFPRIFFPTAFFPGISAQSVFSRKETVTVVRAAIDSDGDGYSDDVEIANGYNPRDARPVKSPPKADPPPAEKVHKVIKSIKSVKSIKSKIKRQKAK